MAELETPSAFRARNGHASRVVAALCVTRPRSRMHGFELCPTADGFSPCNYGVEQMRGTRHLLTNKL